MRPDRLLQWLCRGQMGGRAADRSSPNLQLQTSCCGAGGLLSLLHTDSQAVVATAFAAGLVPTTQAWGPGVAHRAASPKPNQRKRRCQQLGRQTAFAAPAVQAPLVKQLAAVFEAGSSSSGSVTGSFSSSRRHSSDSLSPAADADASVLVSVAAAKLESMPSIKGLLQIWESKAQQHLPPPLSRTSSCASSTSTSSGYSGTTSSSSKVQPHKRCCLRPPAAAAAPLGTHLTAGAVVAAAAAASEVHAGSDADPQLQAAAAAAAAAKQLQAAGEASAAGCQTSGAAAAAARPPGASSAALVSFLGLVVAHTLW